MNRWITWIWQALQGLGEVEYPFPVPAPRSRAVELTDEAVSVAFRELVEREWGRGAAVR